MCLNVMQSFICIFLSDFSLHSNISLLFKKITTPSTVHWHESEQNLFPANKQIGEALRV